MPDLELTIGDKARGARACIHNSSAEVAAVGKQMLTAKKASTCTANIYFNCMHTVVEREE